MITHVLAGGALAINFPQSIAGDRIVCNECLIVGDLQGENLAAFWQTRAKFIQTEYATNTYFEDVVSEFQKLIQLDTQTELYLWFEYELFCQTNLWFVLYLLQTNGFKRIFRVSPLIKPDHDHWKGFGPLNKAELEKSFSASIKMTATDLRLGANLWLAYQANDLHRLKQLSQFQSAAFPFLKEVCQAEIERKRNHYIENTLKAIISTGMTEFFDVFSQFQETAGIYGLGDLQVKKLYAQLMPH